MIVSLTREENMLAAYDLIDHYCHQVVSQFSIIETQRYCPPELKEPIASLIYAAARCTDLPELTEVKDMLTTKYGKEFTVAANEIKPDCGVSRDIIELLSMESPSEKTRLQLMEDICLQHNIEWQPEWAPEASIIPSMQESRRSDTDEGNVMAQRSQRAPSNMRPLRVDQGADPYHYNKGSMHGEDSISKKQEARANIRASGGMAEPYNPRHVMPPKEQVSKINTGIPQEPYYHGTGSKGENADDLYKSGSSRYNPKQGSFLRDKPASPGDDLNQASFLRKEPTRSNLRDSDNIHSPQSYSSGLHPPPEDKATWVNMKGAANGPYKAGFVQQLGQKVARDTKQVSEGKVEICEVGRRSPLPQQGQVPPKINGASLGHRKLPDFKEVTHQGRVENLMQHPDEMSDSGSDIFVYAEDDDAALSQKEGASTNLLEGKKEGKSRESGLHVERYHRGNSQTSNRENSVETISSPKASRSKPDIASDTPWVEKVVHESAALSPDIADSLDEHEFASTAKAIATEAARLAILNYAKQYSRSRSSPKDVANVEDNMSHSRPKGNNADDTIVDGNRKGSGYMPNKPPKTAYNETSHENARQFAVIPSSDGKMNAERPDFGRAHARGSSGSCDADASKRPLFDEEQYFTDERTHRSKHTEGISDPGKQHEFSSNIKTHKLFSTEPDPYFDGLTREEELTYPNQMTREKSKSHRSDRRPHDEHLEDRCATFEGHDQKGPRRGPQRINYDGDHRNKAIEGAKIYDVHNKNSESPSEPHHGRGHEKDLNYIQKEKLGTSSLHKGAPNQAEENSQRTVLAAVDGKGKNSGKGKQGGWASQDQGSLQAGNLLEARMKEQRKPSAKAVDSQGIASRSGKVIHQGREKSVIDEVLGERWHKEESFSKVTLQDKQEQWQGSEGIQNKQQEPAKWSKSLSKDNHMDKISPLQHAANSDFMSLYTPHGQVDDLLKRPMSMRKKPQSHQEELQASVAGYEPDLQKQEIYKGERILPSKQHNYDQPQQAKHRNKQDTRSAGKGQPQNKSLQPKANQFAIDDYEHDVENASAISANHLHKPHPKSRDEGQGKDCQQYDREHKKPTTSGRHSQVGPNGVHMSANQVMSEPPTRNPPTLPQRNHPMSANRVISEPPTRNPPPLPQRNHPMNGGECNQQPLKHVNQKKQVQEDMGAYKHEKLDRTAAPPTRPPPPPVIVKGSERELAELGRPLPEEWRRQRSTSPNNLPHKTPSSKPQSSVSASSSANSKTGDAAKGPPKLPHVDDIAANLEALRRARLGKA